MKTYGQFKRATAIQRHGDLSSTERALLKAYNQGADAGRSDLPRRCPYMPSSEQEKFEAWLCGYDEEATRYTVCDSGSHRNGENAERG